MRYPGDRHVYHFLAPESVHPTCEENLIEKKNTKLQGLLLSHTSKHNQQNQRDVVAKSAANIYLSNKYDFYPKI